MPQTIKAVIFDLDGTLVQSPLDLGLIRRQLSLASNGLPLLESIQALPTPEKDQATRILLEHERWACRESILNWRAAETVLGLRKAGLKVAVLTRNCKASVMTVVRLHGLTVDLIIGREDGPIKPDPYGLLRICQEFGIGPAEAMMVGDHAIDMATARNAGVIPVLMSNHRSADGLACRADVVVGELPELLDLVRIGRF
ncbi:MAG: HAD family hydrolase [Sedimentisphaerales bacterium]|nr:HAD family hydrolase [Sedimentisphaerales bacterium]